MIRPPLAARPATLGRRSAAYAIDIAVAGAIAIACAGVAFGVVLAAARVVDAPTLSLGLLIAAAFAWLALIGWAFAYTAMQGGQGSVGQRALDLRLGDAEGGGAIGFWRALLRNVVWGASCAILLGWFTPLFDTTPRRQGWHDRASGAQVLDTRATDASAPASAVAGVAAARPAAPPAPGPHAPVYPAAAYPAPVYPPPASQRAAVAVAAQLAPAAVAQARPAFPAPQPAAPVAPPTVEISQVPAPAVFRPLAPAAGSTALAPAPRTAVRAPAPAPASAPVTAYALDDLDATRSVTVPPPAARAALFADAPMIAALTWDDGTRMAVYGRTLYGRNPAVEPGIVSVPVRDETLSLSKTHFELGGDASAAWVADRHSTNGTVLVRDGGRHPLPPGVPTLLRAGDRLELGDRSVTVGGAS